MDVNLLKIKRIQTKMDNLWTKWYMRLPDLFLRRVQRGARLLFMFGLHTGLIRAVAGI